MAEVEKKAMKMYPEIAMEKAMKREEIMLRAYAKKMSWIEAAEILGVIVNAGSGSVLGAETAKSQRERSIAFGIEAEVHLAKSGERLVRTLERLMSSGSLDRMRRVS